MGCNCSYQFEDMESLKDFLSESTIDEDIPYEFDTIEYGGNLQCKHGYIPINEAKTIHHIADEFRDHFGKRKAPNGTIKYNDVYFLNSSGKLMETKELGFRYKISGEKFESSLISFDNIFVDIVSDANENKGSSTWLSVYFPYAGFVSFVEKIKKDTRFPINWRGLKICQDDTFKLVCMKVCIDADEEQPIFSELTERYYANASNGQEIEYVESKGRKFSSLKQVKDYEVVRYGTVQELCQQTSKYQTIFRATGFFEFYLVKSGETYSFWKLRIMELWAYGDSE